jgi:hypothetical protein
LGLLRLSLQDSGLLYPIPIKLLNKPEAYNMDGLPVSPQSCHVRLQQKT